MNRGGAAVLTLAILFSIYVNGGYQPSSSRSAPAGEAGAPQPHKGDDESKSQCKFDCPLKYVEDLKQLMKDELMLAAQDKSKCPTKDKEKENEEEWVCWAKRVRVRPFLAIVPDPVHTHLALFFDRQIDAIEQAAQDNGYLFDKAVMPWEYEDHPQSDDFRLRRLEKIYQDDTEKQPGLMVFRRGPATKTDTNQGKAEDQNALLFVFVVAETPTGGIRAEQFRNALTRMHTLSADEDAPTLRILGPTFSGSLYSLRLLLEDHERTHPFCKFQVYSGTVSSYASVTDFNEHLAPTDIFASFSERSDFQEGLFVEFLAKQAFKRSHIAVLAEDETAYGEFRDNNTSSTTQTSGVCSPRCEEDRPVYIYFPREISQLRSAFQREEASGSYEKDHYRSTLKRDFEDVGSDDDTVHTYSRRQLPLSQEAVLLGIVTTLHKHGAEFVILRATDPLDQVFLARYIRKADSNIRIVTERNDLLLRREVEDRLLFGTLSISTYSMRPAADDVQPNSVGREPHRDRVFPDPFSEGTYNAMAALMWAEKWVRVSIAGPRGQPLGYRIRTESHVPLEDYGWPSLLAGPAPHPLVAEAPPVWLTVLGRDGFWPVALLTPDNGSGERVSWLPRLIQLSGEICYLPILWPWKALCAVTITVVFFYLSVVCFGSTLSSSQISQQFAVRMADSRFRAFTIQWFLLLASLLLLCLPWAQRRVDPLWFWGLAPAVACVFLFVGALFDLSSRRVPKRFPWVALPFGALALILLVLVVWPCWPYDSVLHMFMYRYVHFYWWVSPLTPFLFLIGAGLWWSWHAIQGAAHLDQRRPLLPRVDPRCGCQAPRQSSTPKCSSCAECVAQALKRFRANLAAKAAKLGDKIFGSGAPQEDQGRENEQMLPWDLRHLSENEVAPLIDAVTPRGWNHRVHWLLVAYLVPAVALMHWHHPVSSLEYLEYQWYDRLYGVALLITVAGLLSGLLRLYFIWADTKRLLLRLDATPLRRAFRRLRGFYLMPFWGLGASNLPDRERLGRMEVEALRIARNAESPLLRGGLDLVQAALNGITEDQTSAARLNALRKFYSAVAGAAAAALDHLHRRWEHAQWQRERVYDPPDRTVAAAEDFVALVYTNFIQVVLIRMRSLIVSAIGMFVLIVGSLNVYPFEPRATLRNICVALLIVISFVVGLVFTQVRRDATLSLITGTEAGRLGGDFWLKLVQFGALPLLSLLAAQFPDIANFLFSWFYPAATQ